jgi:hypothetical protein
VRKNVKNIYYTIKFFLFVFSCALFGGPAGLRARESACETNPRFPKLFGRQLEDLLCIRGSLTLLECHS